MNIRTPRRLVRVAVVILALCVPASPALASQPYFFTDDFQVTRVNSTLCDFPIRADVTLHYQGSLHFDQAGQVVRLVQHTHHTYRYTNLNTGEAASGLSARQHIEGAAIFHPDGSVSFEGEIRGLNVHLRAPGEGVFEVGAGKLFYRFTFARDGTPIEHFAVPIAGHHEFESATFPRVLCAVLAP
ncbi:MAG TPA: hypothetical protein VER55_06210 [Ardenticatenaceae bacterium]|nr:hypothetical protein [Ardenticatenaceae bacterium]